MINIRKESKPLSNAGVYIRQIVWQELRYIWCLAEQTHTQYDLIVLKDL